MRSCLLLIPGALAIMSTTNQYGPGHPQFPAAELVTAAQQPEFNLAYIGVFEQQLAHAYSYSPWREEVVSKRIAHNREAFTYLRKAGYVRVNEISTAQEDDLFNRLYPLVEGYIKPAFVNGVIRRPLQGLGFTLAGKPLPASQMPNPNRSPASPHPNDAQDLSIRQTVLKLESVLETFRKAGYMLDLDNLDDTMLEAFYPLLFQAQRGSFSHLTRAARYFTSEAFHNALHRQMDRWIPGPYLDLAGTVTHLQLSRDWIPFRSGQSMVSMVQRQWQENMKFEFGDTLIAAVVFPLARRGSFQLVQSTHQAMLDNTELSPMELSVGLMTALQYRNYALAEALLPLTRPYSDTTSALLYCARMLGWKATVDWLEDRVASLATSTDSCSSWLFKYSAFYLTNAGRLVGRLYYFN
ncbi:hypothetical protein H4R33_003870 [Dimargaris cristalligena]|nr:hypothetical protein H4R33_003870 [Dimargaris cristalligena]